MSVTPDPHWDYVALLLHCEGVNNSTLIVDERHKIVTPSGNARLSILQKAFGSTSLYFDGSGDFVTVAANAAFNLGSGDFQIDLRVYPRETANSDPQVFGIGDGATTNQMWLVADGSHSPNKYALFVGNSSTTVPLLVSTSDIVYDAFIPLTISRSNTTWRLMVNGVVEATAEFAGVVNSADTAFLLSSSTAARNFFGYIDEVRLTKGFARNVANFTPPSAQFPDYRQTAIDPHYDKVQLLCHFDGTPGQTTFVDQKRHTLIRGDGGQLVTTQSMFGGTALGAGFVSILPSEDFNLGAGDFTIELFVRSNTSYINNPVHAFLRITEQVLTGRFLEIGFFGGASNIYVKTPNVNPSTNSVNGATNYIVGVGTAAFLPIWLSRVGNNIHFYVTGVRYATFVIGTNTSFNSGGFSIQIGNLGAECFIDEFRLTKGVGRYFDVSHIVPAEPFPDRGVQRLTGTVRDPAGNPIARPVMAFRSSDGLPTGVGVSNPETGAFEVEAADFTEHFVVVQDPEKNALIYDHITPIPAP
jgi:hypothetical protein